MLKQIVSIFGIIILFSALPCFQVSANGGFNFEAPEFTPVLSYGETFALTRSNTISAKKGASYDESKDPALRKGTENWEEPQGSFFIIPAAVIGLIFLILFFNRE